MSDRELEQNLPTNLWLGASRQPRSRSVEADRESRADAPAVQLVRFRNARYPRRSARLTHRLTLALRCVCAGEDGTNTSPVVDFVEFADGIRRVRRPAESRCAEHHPDGWRAGSTD